MSYIIKSTIWEQGENPPKTITSKVEYLRQTDRLYLDGDVTKCHFDELRTAAQYESEEEAEKMKGKIDKMFNHPNMEEHDKDVRFYLYGGQLDIVDGEKEYELDMIMDTTVTPYHYVIYRNDITGSGERIASCTKEDIIKYIADNHKIIKITNDHQ